MSELVPCDKMFARVNLCILLNACVLRTLSLRERPVLLHPATASSTWNQHLRRRCCMTSALGFCLASWHGSTQQQRLRTLCMGSLQICRASLHSEERVDIQTTLSVTSTGTSARGKSIFRLAPCIKHACLCDQLRLPAISSSSKGICKQEAVARRIYQKFPFGRTSRKQGRSSGRNTQSFFRRTWPRQSFSWAPASGKKQCLETNTTRSKSTGVIAWSFVAGANIIQQCLIPMPTCPTLSLSACAGTRKCVDGQQIMVLSWASELARGTSIDSRWLVTVVGGSTMRCLEYLLVVQYCAPG